MEDNRALWDGGRSLDINAAKINPIKKTEPNITKKQPHKIPSLEETNCEELEEEEEEEELIFWLELRLSLTGITYLLERHTQIQSHRREREREMAVGFGSDMKAKA